MQALNSRHRGIEKATDVLSFPQSDKVSPSGPGPLGDIVICIPIAKSQAIEYSVRFYDELLRLLIHGLLHLLGYDHETGAYQKRKMTKKERELLNALQTMA
jgi:probable rRNA maturation factor